MACPALSHVTPGVTPTLCRRPIAGEHIGTYSVTSIGGVGTTFLLEWLKRLHRVFQQPACSSSSSSNESCGCPALAERGSLPRHLISCHIDDDGLFKHLADPAQLSGFGAGHRAVYLVGSPLAALSSVFRRRFQCWHYHRLNDCWFTRRQRGGRIPCASPRMAELRRLYGEEATTCRVPPVGPLSSLEAYAEHGADLFGETRQFKSWLSCRKPRCSFDIFVLRLPRNRTDVSGLHRLFDFLELPERTRLLFPYERLHERPHRRRNPDVSGGALSKLRAVYGGLEEAVERLPAEGLLLRNR